MSNATKNGLVKRWRKFLSTIPHLFAKLIVVFCVLFASGCSVYCMRIMMYTDHNPAQLLTAILAFFGGELLLMCLKTVLTPRTKKSKKSSEDTQQEDPFEYTPSAMPSNDDEPYTNF